MIKDVVIKELPKHEDDRGYLRECYRRDEGGHIPQMMYMSETKPGIARGPHEHEFQTDFFIFFGPGDFELYLWDNRPKSNTYKEHVKVIVGESNPVSVEVPPGVIHGYKNVGTIPAVSINIPDSLYKGWKKEEAVDEIRHEELEDEFKI